MPGYLIHPRLNMPEESVAPCVDGRWRLYRRIWRCPSSSMALDIKFHGDGHQGPTAMDIKFHGDGHQSPTTMGIQVPRRWASKFHDDGFHRSRTVLWLLHQVAVSNQCVSLGCKPRHVLLSLYIIRYTSDMSRRRPGLSRRNGMLRRSTGWERSVTVERWKRTLRR